MRMMRTDIDMRKFIRGYFAEIRWKAFPSDIRSKLRILPGVEQADRERFFLNSSYQFSEKDLQSYSAPYQYRGVTYFFPYRLGYQEAKGRPKGEVQKVINLCMLTRHSDGFVREKAVVEIFLYSDHFTFYPFVIPYILRLLGEYVNEISEQIYNHRELLPKKELKQFCGENKRFLEQTRQRAISYWDCNYRQQGLKLKDVPAIRFFDWLGVLLQGN